ncbi:MAG: GNAT family N-acetyltransferase [Anaerolineae bacterium]
MIDIRVLHTIEELKTVVELEIAVWGLAPHDAVPTSLMHVIALRGGLALGAYEGDQMIGLLLGLPVRDHDRWILWSHMTGIHPDHQGKGVGTALKLFQRQWALQNGFTTIGWTFDPLQSGNARFNFHLLGQSAALSSHIYHVNFYGEMDDDINRGMPSDRIEAIWDIDQPSLHDHSQEHAPWLLEERNGLPHLANVSTFQWDAIAYRIAIPRDLDAVRRASPGAVLSWRLALREAMQAAFEQGFAAVDFLTQNGECAYLLKRTISPS